MTKLCRDLLEHIKVFCANSLTAVDEIKFVTKELAKRTCEDDEGCVKFIHLKNRKV